MNIFPDYGISYRSTVTPDSGVTTDITQAGTLRTRAGYAQTVYTLALDLPYLIAAEATAIKDFYAANSGADFFYTYPLGTSAGERYTVRFAAEPEIRKVTPEYYSAKVRLIGVRS